MEAETAGSAEAGQDTTDGYAIFRLNPLFLTFFRVHALIARMKSLQTLLNNVIDYAGLFPPAKLDMQQAVENYSNYLKSEYAWMLGRFIIPTSRLQEFEHSFRSVMNASGGKPWNLAVLAGPNLSDDVTLIQGFNARHSGNGVCIDTFEMKGSSPQEIPNHVIPSDSITAYMEIPIEEDPTPLVEAIGRIGARAKMRTGGISENLFPTSTNLVRFMSACVQAGVPFKATAGLHHPVRARYRLTYENDSPSAMMYGFLNILLTAAFISSGLENQEAVRLLEEQDSRAFRFDEGGVTWNGQRLPVAAISNARATVAISFGSCSFAEPVDELMKLGFLGLNAREKSSPEQRA